MREKVEAQLDRLLLQIGNLPLFLLLFIRCGTNIVILDSMFQHGINRPSDFVCGGDQRLHWSQLRPLIGAAVVTAPLGGLGERNVKVVMEILSVWPIVSHAIAYGVLLSGVLFPLSLVMAWINPEIMLKNYPPDIQAKYGPMSDRAKRQRIPVAIIFGALLVAIVARSYVGVRASAGGDIPLQAAFVHALVMLSVFNLLDWLVLDWLIVVAIRPRFLILPGTEGLAGYSNYRFHFRGFLVGTVITFVTSVLVAGIVAVLF